MDQIFTVLDSPSANFSTNLSLIRRVQATNKIGKRAR